MNLKDLNKKPGKNDIGELEKTPENIDEKTPLPEKGKIPLPEISKPGGKVKRRGRHKKDCLCEKCVEKKRAAQKTVEKEKENELQPDALRPVAEFLSSMGDSRHPILKWTDKEKESFGPVFAPIINKYVPLMNRFPEEFAALGFIGAFIGSRWGAIQELKRLSVEQEENAGVK